VVIAMHLSCNGIETTGRIKVPFNEHPQSLEEGYTRGLSVLVQAWIKLEISQPTIPKSFANAFRFLDLPPIAGSLSLSSCGISGNISVDFFRPQTRKTTSTQENTFKIATRFSFIVIDTS
jgi:hypothetical protein